MLDFTGLGWPLAYLWYCVIFLDSTGSLKMPPLVHAWLSVGIGFSTGTMGITFTRHCGQLGGQVGVWCLRDMQLSLNHH